MGVGKVKTGETKPERRNEWRKSEKKYIYIYVAVPDRIQILRRFYFIEVF